MHDLCHALCIQFFCFVLFFLCPSVRPSHGPECVAKLTKRINCFGSRDTFPSTNNFFSDLTHSYFFFSPRMINLTCNDTPPRPPHPFPNLSIIWDCTERVRVANKRSRHCVTVSSQTVVPACTEGMRGRQRRRWLALSAAPAQYPPLFFSDSDMHSKWLGQTCASLIRLFTLLLFFPPSSSSPPSSVSHSWKHKHIHTFRNMPNKRCTVADTLVFVFCSLVFCVCDVNYKNKVIKVLPAFMLSVIITTTKKKKTNAEYFLYFFALCLRIYSRLATQCSPSPQVFAQMCNRLPPQTWLSCCIKAEHQWSCTSPFFFFLPRDNISFFAESCICYPVVKWGGLNLSLNSEER